MAREIRVRQRTEVVGARGDGLERREFQPTTVEEARRAIESTRGRISETLDAIEERIQEKREDLRSRLDVLRPLRRRIRLHVWPSLGIALGTGLVLGLLGGREGERGRGRAGMLSEAERRELRDWRAERRDRLEQRLARSARGRSRRKGALFAEIRSTLGQAVVDGLRDRMRGAGR